MVYWHLEKAGDLKEFDDFRLKKQPIEEAYLKLRTAAAGRRSGVRGRS